MNLEAFRQDLFSQKILPDEQPTVFQDAMREILTYAREQHFQTIQKSERLWKEWIAAVGQLQNMIEATGEQFRPWKITATHAEKQSPNLIDFRSLLKLIFCPIKQNRLYNLLAQDEVEFRISDDSPQTQNILVQLLALISISDPNYLSRDYAQQWLNGLENAPYYHDRHFLPLKNHLTTRTLKATPAPPIRQLNATGFRNRECLY